MPKIILDAQDNIILAAKEILKKNGYNALSVRSVANKCNIAVGTIYNYFQNKNQLVAAAILQDWNKALLEIDEAIIPATDFPEGMCRIYSKIEKFVFLYQDTWRQFSDMDGSSWVITSHHRVLRQQISKRIEKLIDKTGYKKLESCLELLAETVLAAVLQPDISINQFRTMMELL